MRRAIALALLLTGCSESATELTAWQKAMRDGSIETVAATKAVESKTDEAIGILRDNATALAAIKSQIEALQVVSKTANSEEVIKSAPNPPAKANTALAPLKVATPGDFSEPETLVELATRLHARGVSVHMKTEDQLRAIDAQMLGTKSTPVQYQSRPTYSQPSGTVCIDGQCFTPQRVSRKRR
jgi:hypothetical protein